MILRVIRGRVVAGRESDFVELCRQTVADRARSPGLVSFFPGYRRAGGVDHFILAAMWESAEHAQAGAGSADRPVVRDVLAGVADVDSVEVFEGVEPVFRGIVDAPGGVVRLTSATLKPGHRVPLFEWLEAGGRVSHSPRLVLGWAIGQRELAGKDQMVAVSAWPSPLVIESLSDSDGVGNLLFAASAEHVDDVTVEHYQAIGLDLPSHLSELGARRVLAGRFAARETAHEAAAALTREVSSVAESPPSVAPLGESGARTRGPSWILVVRVALADYGRAERLIADHGGDIILARPEPLDEPRPADLSVAPDTIPSVAPAD